jgi:hypothetical protein
MTCSVKGCENPVKYKELCGKHYKRQWRHGDPNQTAYWRKEKGMLCIAPDCAKFARHGEYCTAHYIRMKRYGSLELLKDGKTENNYYYGHRQRAEKALGRPLPAGVDVHHHNGEIKTLVICPDRAYHMLLHKRMRRLKKGLPLENFTPY